MYMLTGHSAYDFEEFAEALKKAYKDCTHVEALEKFTNFTKTVDKFLNVASQTEGHTPNCITTVKLKCLRALFFS